MLVDIQLTYSVEVIGLFLLIGPRDARTLSEIGPLYPEFMRVSSAAHAFIWRCNIEAAPRRIK